MPFTSPAASPSSSSFKRDGTDVPLELTPVQAPTPDGQTVWQIGVIEKRTRVSTAKAYSRAVKDAGLETYLEHAPDCAGHRRTF